VSASAEVIFLLQELQNLVFSQAFKGFFFFWSCKAFDPERPSEGVSLIGASHDP
jgi:hypothetical protein